MTTDQKLEFISRQLVDEFKAIESKLTSMENRLSKIEDYQSNLESRLDKLQISEDYLKIDIDAILVWARLTGSIIKLNDPTSPYSDLIS